MINNKTRKILYISGTRADYGLMKNTLKEIANKKNIALKIGVCGMHLSKKHGNSIEEIKSDNFDLIELKSHQQDDSKEEIGKFIANLSNELNSTFSKEKPNIILLLGDRAEMLCAATIATYHKIPIAHIHGGDLSETIDDPVRHAITKLSHIHFPATQSSQNRIQKLGEEKNRIYNCGAPGLDEIYNTKFSSRKSIFEKLNLKDMDTCIAIYHPTKSDPNKTKAEMDIILNSLNNIKIQTVIIYPNSDSGSNGIIKSIENNKNNSLFKIFKNLSHDDYLDLMKHSKFMIGNSSGGIIESKAINLPVINIGNRQNGRERSDNIFDTKCEQNSIDESINKALSYDKNNDTKNPYGNGDAGKKIATILSTIKLDEKLINKRMTY